MISCEKITQLCEDINPVIHIHLDGCEAIQTLVQPWDELISRSHNFDELIPHLNRFLPNELYQIMTEKFSSFIQAKTVCQDQPEISPELYKKIQKGALTCIIVGILEATIEYAQIRGSKDLDSYDIYTGILNHPMLKSMFHQSIPNFPHFDELRVSDILLAYPNIEPTNGFVQGLQNYMDTIVQLIIDQPIENIDNLAKTFSQIEPSQTRQMAIHQLKNNLVQFVIDKSGPQPSFTDVLTHLKFLQKT